MRQNWSILLSFFTEAVKNHSYFFSNSFPSCSVLTPIFLGTINNGELLFIQYRPHRWDQSLHRGMVVGGGSLNNPAGGMVFPWLLPSLSQEGPQPHDLGKDASHHCAVTARLLGALL